MGTDIDAELALLVAFAEWLDSQGLIVGESETDRRTHTEIATQFCEEQAKAVSNAA